MSTRPPLLILSRASPGKSVVSRCSRLDLPHGCNVTLPGDLSVRVVVGQVPGCSPLYYSSPVDGCPCACGPHQTAEAYSNVGHTTVVPGRSPT